MLPAVVLTTEGGIMNINRGILALPIALLLLSCAASSNLPANSQPSPADMEAARSAKKPSTQKAAEKAVIKYFARTLKDPDSAHYTFLSPANGIVNIGGPLAPAKYESGWFLCGTINAKNSYGGYVGQRAFFVHFAQAIPDVVDDGAMDSGEYNIVANWCQKLYGHAP
jgi:hypothetical protein